ncbi:MAG TPA: DNA alkylation repair protein [Lachnospiraceae bacterium]|nr:DNA alkylation repair protein [Lachnospiraceae bacterium]
MEEIFEQVRTELIEAADEKYRAFNSSLIPGASLPILGVRMPKLRSIAKKLAKNHGLDYIHTASEWARQEQPFQKQLYFEELLLHGILIGYLECDIAEREQLLDAFIPQINNWSVCDSSCVTYKFVKEDEEHWFSYLLQYTESDREYELRFAVVMFLIYFITETYIDRILEAMAAISHEAYYVKMAVAWAISMCYVKFPEKTWVLLESDRLDDFTHRKSLQKIRESFQVSKGEKDRLLTLRRDSGTTKRKRSSEK